MWSKRCDTRFLRLTRESVLACTFKKETLKREGNVIVTAVRYTGVHFGAGRRGWNFENRPSHRGVIAYTWFELPLVTQMCTCVHTVALYRPRSTIKDTFNVYPGSWCICNAEVVKAIEKKSMRHSDSGWRRDKSESMRDATALWKC